MSETVLSTYRCNLCSRDFKKYNKKDESQIHGIEVARTKTYSQIIKFVAPDKSPDNKHICAFCVADVCNKFEI